MNQETRSRYMDTFGCRFTKKQKAQARQALCEDFEALGYQSEVETKRNLILKANNVMFGNLKSSRYVVMVPYDTPGRIFWPNIHYYPLDGNKSAAKATLPTYAPIVIFYFVFLGLLYALPAIAMNAYAYLTLAIISIVIFAFIFVLLFRGLPNKQNANRNTSGVLAAIELAQSLSKDQRRQVSFVFTDRNENRYFGSKLLADRLKNANKNPMILAIHCVGDGEHLVLGASNGTKKMANEMMKKYKGSQKISMVPLQADMQVQSLMGYFQKGISIASGEIDDKGSLVVDHTCSTKDTVLQDEHVDQIVTMLKTYLENNK